MKPFARISRRQFLEISAAGLFAPSVLASPKAELSIVDLCGRTVVLKKPPQRFVVANYILNFLMVSGAAGVNKIVGLTQDGWLETRRAEYVLLQKAFPQLMTRPSIGGYHDSILNSEKILALKPDVLLINRTQYEDNTQRIRIFEAAGIAVIVLDYHSMKPEAHAASTRILGALLGCEDKARAQCERYSEVLADIKKRIAALPETKKHVKVYIEAGNRGVAEYGNSYNRNVLWGAILENLQAKNLAADMKQPYGALDREYVVGGNPQIIIIAGSLWENSEASDLMRMGLTVDPQTAQKRLGAFARRSMWQNLDALKTGRFYGIDHGSLRCMMDYAFSIFLAQALYPGVFDDYDANAEIQGFFKTYLPEIDAKGTFFIRLAQQ